MRQYSLASGGGCAKSDDIFSATMHRVEAGGGSIPKVATGRTAIASTFSCSGLAAVNCEGQLDLQDLLVVALSVCGSGWHGA